MLFPTSVALGGSLPPQFPNHLGYFTSSTKSRLDYSALLVGDTNASKLLLDVGVLILFLNRKHRHQKFLAGFGGFIHEGHSESLTIQNWEAHEKNRCLSTKNVEIN